MQNSKIEWCDHTFNPWIGCAKVSPGCAHCYAEGLMFQRYGKVKWGKGEQRSRTSPANWRGPIRWNENYFPNFPFKCPTCGSYHQGKFTAESTCSGFPYGSHAECKVVPNHRPRVFCASLADWLDDEVPIKWLADLLKLIYDTPNLDWLLLTKRPENWESRIEKVWIDVPTSDFSLWLARWLGTWTPAKKQEAPHNVWIGTSVEDQARADERIPHLLRIPAVVRFLSMEPLLGPVQFVCPVSGDFEYSSGDEYNPGGIHWVIAGGESGPKARPMHPDWARSIRDQCQNIHDGVPFLFKQWGEWAIETPKAGGDLGGDLRRGVVQSVRPKESDEMRMPGCAYMRRVGKAKAGRLLDGREWNEFPKVEVAA